MIDTLWHIFNVIIINFQFIITNDDQQIKLTTFFPPEAEAVQPFNELKNFYCFVNH